MNHRKEVHWSDYDMKGAFFKQRIGVVMPCKNVYGMNYRLPLQITIRVRQRLDRVPTRTGTTQRLYKIIGSYTDVYSTIFFKRYSPTKEQANISKAKPTIKSNDRMYIVDSGASLLLMGKVPSMPRKENIRNIKDYWKIQTANGIVRSTKEAKVHIQKLGTYLYVKLVEDFPSALSLGRLCDEFGYSYSWTRRKPQIDERLEDVHMLN